MAHTLPNPKDITEKNMLPTVQKIVGFLFEFSESKGNVEMALYDRLVSLEKTVEKGFESMDKRFEDQTEILKMIAKNTNPL